MELLKSGIAGFDAATGGGIPKGTRTILYGPPGTGKTVFAMQFLWAGLSAGERVAYNVCDRPFAHARRYFESFGWEIGPYQDDGMLVALQSFPRFTEEASEEGVEFIQGSDLATLQEVTTQLSAQEVSRVVVGDYSQALYALVPAKELLPLGNWMVEWTNRSGITLMEVITATQVDIEAHKGWSLSLKAAHNVIQFRIHSGRREIRILKMEGASHPLDWVPIEVGAKGIEMGVA
ncbi:MAG: hypothetical protein KAY32_12990 [Candidatus Eisenbacteria sp.]|nr:hypothetical protein [Candidatus Eisenbacteria bacterium]